MRKLVVVDTSVICKCYFEEDLTADAQRLLESNCDLLAPSLLMAEVSNVIWKRIRKKEASLEQAETIFLELRRNVTLIPDDVLAPAAIRIAARLDHPAYDCFFLAAAEGWGIPMVTADRKLIAKAGTTLGNASLIHLAAIRAHLAAGEPAPEGQRHA